MEGRPPKREKGKKIAEDTVHDLNSSGAEHTTVPEAAGGSSLSRITRSATSLSGFIMSGPPGTLPGGSEKGEASRVGQALDRAGDSSVRVRPNIPSGGTIKMGQTQEHIAQQEATFAAFLESDDAPMLSEPGGLNGAWELANAPTNASPAVSAIRQPSQTVTDQMAKDGADVVALLSAHDTLEAGFELPTPQPVSQTELANLHKALFGEGSENSLNSVAWDHVLNFIPEYLHGQGAVGTEQGNDLLSTHFGMTDNHDAWRSWIDQWSRILTDYQDEVWGDLGALVDEARVEVKQMEEAKPGEKPELTALLRLRAILGHLRGD